VRRGRDGQEEGRLHEDPRAGALRSRCRPFSLAPPAAIRSRARASRASLRASSGGAGRGRAGRPRSESVITPHPTALCAPLAGRARDPVHRHLRARRAPDAVQGGAERGDRSWERARRHRGPSLVNGVLEKIAIALRGRGRESEPGSPERIEIIAATSSARRSTRWSGWATIARWCGPMPASNSR
jgi:hypothetical protein